MSDFAEHVRKNGIKDLRPENWMGVNEDVRSGLDGVMPLTAYLLNHASNLDGSSLRQTTLECGSDKDKEEMGVFPSPQFILQKLELPIIHTDGEGSIRDQATVIGQQIEKTVVDAVRNDEHLTKMPVIDHAWQNVEHVLNMKKSLQLLNFFGPYFILHGHKNADHTINLHHVAHGVEGIEGSVCSKLLDKDDLFLVQNTEDVTELVVCIEPTAVMWENKLRMVACIVPRFRHDMNGRMGVAKLER